MTGGADQSDVLGASLQHDGLVVALGEVFSHLGVLLVEAFLHSSHEGSQSGVEGEGGGVVVAHVYDCRGWGCDVKREQSQACTCGEPSSDPPSQPH